MKKLINILQKIIEILLLIGCSMFIVLGIVLTSGIYFLVGCMFVIIYALLEENKEKDKL